MLLVVGALVHHTLAARVDGEDLVLHLNLDIIKVVLRVVVFKTNILQNILLLKTFADILGSLANLSIYSYYRFELIDEEGTEHKTLNNAMLIPQNITISITLIINKVADKHLFTFLEMLRTSLAHFELSFFIFMPADLLIRSIE